MGKASFRFRGRFEKHGDEVWAVCDHAPVFVAGVSEESALGEMAEAVADYLDVLFERGAINEAVAAGMWVRAGHSAPYARGVQRLCRVWSGRVESPAQNANG